jgi:16S rRNA (guanine966-N2)-methyltransferase
VRETLFNWLQTKVVEARCLDLFAGSGALGLEALSRGAAHVAFVDREGAVVRHLKNALRMFQAANADVIATDAMAFLSGVPKAFDIVFLDPPFASDVLTKVCQRLNQGWLSKDAYVYLECSARSPLPVLPPGWLVYRSKRAGEVGYHLVRVEAEVAEKSK